MQIEFTYSRPYDNLVCRLENKKLKDYREIFDFIKKLDSKKKLLNKICSSIENLIGLRYNKNIKCYLISDSPWRGISDPLTIRTRSLDEFLSILLHELIHLIIIQNPKEHKRLDSAVYKKFKCSEYMRNHIIVYALELKLRKIIKLKDNPLKNPTSNDKEFRESFLKSIELAKKLERYILNKNAYLSIIRCLEL
jgi:hypothetical protein